MDHIHSSDWLNFALLLWVVISLLAAPLVGRFLSGVLREQTDKAEPTAATRASDTGKAPRTVPFPGLKARM